MTRIGDKIQMKQGIEATVKYIGPIDRKDGQWIGLELNKELGKHNGTIDGRSYYECREGCGLLVRYEKFPDFICKYTNSGQDLSADSPLRDNSILFKDCTIKVEDAKQNKNQTQYSEDKNDVKDIIRHNIYLSEINKYTKQVAALRKIITRQEAELEIIRENHIRELDVQKNKLKREVEYSNELVKKLSDTKKNFISAITSFEREARESIHCLETSLSSLNPSESSEISNRDHKKICHAFKNMLNSFIDNEEEQLQSDIDNLKSLFESKGIY